MRTLIFGGNHEEEKQREKNRENSESNEHGGWWVGLVLNVEENQPGGFERGAARFDELHLQAPKFNKNFPLYIATTNGFYNSMSLPGP